MRVLLDTHALLWWLSGSRSLTATALVAIADDRNVVFVSAASAWEIATKHRIGKFGGVAALVADFNGIIVGQRFTGLPISLMHAQTAGGLQIEHRDPFDRMLIAQARLERLTLVSNEDLFDTFGVERLW